MTVVLRLLEPRDLDIAGVVVPAAHFQAVVVAVVAVVDVEEPGRSIRHIPCVVADGA